jgi:hypothetical protein
MLAISKILLAIAAIWEAGLFVIDYGTPQLVVGDFDIQNIRLEIVAVVCVLFLACELMEVKEN